MTVRIRHILGCTVYCDRFGYIIVKGTYYNLPDIQNALFNLRVPFRQWTN